MKAFRKVAICLVVLVVALVGCQVPKYWNVYFNNTGSKASFGFDLYDDWRAGKIIAKPTFTLYGNGPVGTIYVGAVKQWFLLALGANDNSIPIELWYYNSLGTYTEYGAFTIPQDGYVFNIP